MSKKSKGAGKAGKSKEAAKSIRDDAGAEQSGTSGQASRSGKASKSRVVAASDPTSSACLRFGWMMVAVFLTGGMLLESFHLIKLPLYLDVLIRRELWTLAHAHGALLGAIVILFGLSATRLVADEQRRRTAGRLLRVGAVLVPTGFFLGGIGNAEGDPSLAILLVPTGAALALLGIGLALFSGRR